MSPFPPSRRLPCFAALVLCLLAVGGSAAQAAAASSSSDQSSAADFLYQLGVEYRQEGDLRQAARRLDADGYANGDTSSATDGKKTQTS